MTDLKKMTYRDLLSEALNPLADSDRSLGAIKILEDRLAEEKWLLVSRERKAGASWTDIGNRFGITRQAAQQRFGKFGEQSLFN